MTDTQQSYLGFERGQSHCPQPAAAVREVQREVQSLEGREHHL